MNRAIEPNIPPFGARGSAGGRVASGGLSSLPGRDATRTEVWRRLFDIAGCGGRGQLWGYDLDWGRAVYRDGSVSVLGGLQILTHLPVKKNLTVIGDSRDSVIIGGEGEYPPPGPSSIRALALLESVTSVSVSGVRIEGSTQGISGGGVVGLKTSNLAFERCLFGISLEGGSVDAAGVEFGECDTGVIVRQAVSGVSISGSTFKSCTFGVDSYSRGNAALLERNSFLDCGVGAQFIGSRGVVKDCQFLRIGVVGVNINDQGADVSVSNCIFQGGYRQIHVTDFSEGRIESCDFSDAIQNAIWITSGAQVTASNNHFRSDGPILVSASGYSIEPMIELDFANNYWGTTESDSIAARIFDGLDPQGSGHIPNNFRVKFEPFLAQEPVATERRSMGALKAGY